MKSLAALRTIRALGPLRAALPAAARACWLVEWVSVASGDRMVGDRHYSDEVTQHFVNYKVRTQDIMLAWGTCLLFDADPVA